MKKILVAVAATAALVSCTSQPSSKVLVLYYSQSGVTKTVAEEIARQTGADIVSFDVQTPYNGTYDETIQRCLKERESGELSPVKPLSVNIADYDVVFLGYPVWFGTCARPLLSLIAEQDFAGKKVVPFCTFGSGGLNTSSADLVAALPKATIAEGYGVRAARVEKAPAEIDRFLIAQGYKEGTVEPLPAFSEIAPVGGNEATIFNTATSDYFMPLGTPVSFQKRDTPSGVEYIFTAESVGMDGAPATSLVYVLAAPGAAPEFTQVVR